MNALKEILAKSKPAETLTRHTTKVLEIWQQLKERYSEEITENDFWQLSFLAVAYHDFGKICNRFQDSVKGRRAFNDDERVRHEFFSGLFLFLNDPEFYLKDIESLIAVFSHHKAFNDEGFIEHISRNPVIDFELDERQIDEFVFFVNQIAKKNELEKFEVSEKNNTLINSEYRQLLSLFKKSIYRKISTDDFLGSENRKRYIFHKAILNISDWTASGHLDLETGKAYNKKYLADKIIEKLRAEDKNEVANKFDFKEFQKKSAVDNNVIAIAPTGSGKTEAALLWASSKKDWERIIYLLPTRVTSNSIYNRLTSYFGTEHTQLIHSSARQYIKERVDNTYGDKYFRDKSFFKNINICTVDQLLTLGFNLGYWEVKTFHLLNARVIIDEIHLYSPYTLGLIISTIKYLKNNFNTRFYIMTATMPEKLQVLLGKTLGDFSLIKDEELLDKARNRFEIRENQIDESLEEIITQIEEGEKVLVVVNTVDKAIELYEKLKLIAEESGHEALCYHSRFIKKDRFSKEQEIFTLDEKNCGGVLIATQVVEVSLDIDFDILFTENAPIDAIIQRAGRVNRKRKKKNSKVIIFRHQEITEKIYDVENVLESSLEEFKKADGEKLSERDLNELVNVVYKNIDVEKNENYQKGLEKHLDIQHQQYFIKDLTSDADVFTREGLDTVSVIPDEFEERLYDSTAKDLLRNHELSISRRRFYASKSTKGPFDFKFIKADYDDEKGMTFIDKDENKGYSV